MFKRSTRKILLRVFSRKPTRRVSALLSLIHIHRVFATPKLRLFVSRKLRKEFCIFVSPKCQYGTNLCIKHPVGVVIGSGVRVGNDVTIFQNVTLGGRRLGDGGTEQYPTIGDGTVIFAGAVILGDVRVGSNCVIGANAVVLSDIPDNSTAVGVPAKVLLKKEREE